MRSFRLFFLLMTIAFLGTSCERFQNPDAPDIFYAGDFINTWKMDSAILFVYAANGTTVINRSTIVYEDNTGAEYQPVRIILPTAKYVHCRNTPQDTLYSGLYSFDNGTIRYDDHSAFDFVTVTVNDSIFIQEGEIYNDNGELKSQTWYQSAY